MAATLSTSKAIPSCTCPDFELRQQPCKHIYAVESVSRLGHSTDGSQTITTTEMQTVKVTYKQNWPAYNAAQTEEKERFIVLLDALSKLVDQPAHTNGRPPFPLANMVFACVYKVYVGFSSRRFMSDLREAQSKECIHKTPHFNRVSQLSRRPCTDRHVYQAGDPE